RAPGVGGRVVDLGVGGQPALGDPADQVQPVVQGDQAAGRAALGQRGQGAPAVPVQAGQLGAGPGAVVAAGDVQRPAEGGGPGGGDGHRQGGAAGAAAGP